MAEIWDLIEAEKAAQVRDAERQEMARFCLGDPGEHFETEEWERRADLLADPLTRGSYLRGELT